MTFATKERAEKFARDSMTRFGVPFAYAAQNDDGTWRVEMVA